MSTPPASDGEHDPERSPRARFWTIVLALTVTGLIAGAVLGIQGDDQCVRDAGGAETDLCHLGVLFGPVYGVVGGFLTGLAVAFVAGAPRREVRQRILVFLIAPAAARHDTW